MNCTCHTCAKQISKYAIEQHRRQHLMRGESCRITYHTGETKQHHAVFARTGGSHEEG